MRCVEQQCRVGLDLGVRRALRLDANIATYQTCILWHVISSQPGSPLLGSGLSNSYSVEVIESISKEPALSKWSAVTACTGRQLTPASWLGNPAFCSEMCPSHAPFVGL